MADQPIQDLQAADPLRATLGGRLVLDQIPCLITLSMGSRSFRWTLDLQDTTGVYWIQGHALVSQADVFRPYRALQPDLPPGILYAYAVNGDGSDPVGFDAWRTTHELRYRPVADLVAAAQ